MCWYIWHHTSENEIRNIPQKIMWGREGFFRGNQCPGVCISPCQEGFSYQESLGEEASQSYAHPPPIPKSLDQFC